MKAIVIYEAGGPEKLLIEDRAIPEVTIGKVLVKIKAFGLNRSELMTRKGYSSDVSFPRILGIECVGEVASDPSGVFEPGQKVAACMGGMGRDYDGSYAEYALLPAAILTPFSSNLPWATLGALPEMFQTAYGSLYLALEAKAGETILIRGGTSSIGLMAIQMARNTGLYVIGTTRNPEHEALLLKSGCDEVWIDNGQLQKNTEKTRPINKLLELIGTGTLKDSLSCVTKGGIVCMTGMLSEQWSLKDFKPMDFIPALTKLTVYDSGQVRIPATHFQSFLTDVATGKITPPLGAVFKIEEIVEALQLMEHNKAKGKIVVVTERP